MKASFWGISPLLLALLVVPVATSHVFLGPAACLDQKLTRQACSHVLCPPWERCIEGVCECKIPYQCPRGDQAAVCAKDSRLYSSYCQAMAVSCRSKKPLMSHFGKCTEEMFSSSIGDEQEVVVMMKGEELAVCAEGWDMAAANVICRENNHPLGAQASLSMIWKNSEWTPEECVSVRCQGYENSLAECSFSNKRAFLDGAAVATAHCYTPDATAACQNFTCVNRKCVSLERTCDGVDDCGDRSDEMCCQDCRGDAFRCLSGVCVSRESVRDNMVDCLSGEDEKPDTPTSTDTPTAPEPVKDFISPKDEIRKARTALETLRCGVPNATTVDQEEVPRRAAGRRRKRVVGGVPAKPTQIQWQVAIQEDGRIDCGGAYIGGCWVLTAAHCVRPRPSAFKVKFSLWRKRAAQGTTDIVPVEDIIIHHGFDGRTYENDIALMKLQKLPFENKCLTDNPAVSAVCVPWSLQQFQPNYTCSISGWGRDKAGRSADVLLWANVSLITNCGSFYKDRFKPGMMCAGDLEGSVDSCQGDSGGPLVCEDSLGVSYLWGIVSWGEKCGSVNFPGVYTQVAHYFEWIRQHTTWEAVTKYP